MITELQNKMVRCRKPHRCTWCGEWMFPGERAVYRAGVYDGDFFSEHWHNECLDAMMRSDLGYDNEFYPFDQLRGRTFEESHN